MKKIIIFLVLGLVATACNNNGNSIQKGLDSLGEQIDTAGKKIWDTTKAKAKDLKEEVEKELKNRRDSI